jgi:predicted RNase H-like nuclease
MRIVMGIDAAWTAKHPSGVALAVQHDGQWLLRSVAPSYEAFITSAQGAANPTPQPAAVTAGMLIASATALAGKAPDLVAIDMPLSHEPIKGRRAADSAISRAYGAQWCSTHTPSPDRPGPISDALLRGFAKAGYPLCTQELVLPGLIEVYPHPALVMLAKEPRRLPYKVSKARAYWPCLTPRNRVSKIQAEWECIATVLEPYLQGISDWLRNRPGGSMKELKATEDMLDAIVCCVCAIRALNGAVEPFGDSQSAIWVPKPDPVIQERTLLPSSPYSPRAEMRQVLYLDGLLRGEDQL